MLTVVGLLPAMLTVVGLLPAMLTIVGLFSGLRWFIFGKDRWGTVQRLLLTPSTWPAQ